MIQYLRTKLRLWLMPSEAELVQRELAARNNRPESLRYQWEDESGMSLRHEDILKRLGYGQVKPAIDFRNRRKGIDYIIVSDPEQTLHRETAEFQAPIMEDDNMRQWTALS